MRITMTQINRDHPRRIVLQIHDSLVARIRASEVEFWKTYLPTTIASTFSHQFSPVPFKADIKPFGGTAAKLKVLAS